MDKLRRVLSGNDSPDEESGIMSQVRRHLSSIFQTYSFVPFLFQLDDASTFSWSTRLKGFLACFIVGILFSFLGSFALFLPSGLPVFAVFYTLGNITAILSTCFLMGPFNQFKRMFAQTRLIATIIVIVSLILTIVAAIVVSKILRLLNEN